jgi:phage shock protein PspC (stress-responsive transcriptional regulator)
LLLKEFGVFNYFYWWKLPWGSIWAIFLIVLGIFIIYAGRNNSRSDENKESVPLISGLNNIYRSKNNRMIAGVCGGIGEYFNIDPSIVRLIWILASFASVGIGIVVYLILIFVFPENPDQEQT